MLFIYMLYSLRRFGSVRRLMPAMTITLLAACAEPYVHPSSGDRVLPQLTESYALMEDGFRLPLSRWEAIGNTRAIVLALHGFNDYSSAFDSLGQYLSPRGITVIAYDQRGIGKTAGHGLWHGSDRMSKDMVIITGQLLER